MESVTFWNLSFESIEGVIAICFSRVFVSSFWRLSKRSAFGRMLPHISELTLQKAGSMASRNKRFMARISSAWQSIYR